MSYDYSERFSNWQSGGAVQSHAELLALLDNAIQYAEETKVIAQEAIAQLDASEQHLTQVANDALDKYPLL